MRSMVSISGLWRLGTDVSCHHQHLDDTEGKRYSQQPEDLEIDPEVCADLFVQMRPEIKSNIEIEQAAGQKEQTPGNVDLFPDGSRHLHLAAEKSFENRPFPNELTTQHNYGKDPVHYGGLPFDKHIVSEEQGHSAEEQNDEECHQVRGFKALVPNPYPDYLGSRGRHGHKRGHVYVIQLISTEKQDQRKKIKEEFHEPTEKSEGISANYSGRVKLALTGVCWVDS